MSSKRNLGRSVLIVLAVVALGIGLLSGGFATREAAAQTGAAVSIVDFAFSPAWVEVPAGSTVWWTNYGAAPHTVTSDFGGFDSGTLGTGGGFSLYFDTAGTYTYHCAIHPGMTGGVVVGGGM